MEALVAQHQILLSFVEIRILLVVEHQQLMKDYQDCHRILLILIRLMRLGTGLILLCSIVFVVRHFLISLLLPF